MCALQCDKMGVKWNSRFKKERGLDFGATRPSGSESEREIEGWRHRERDDAGSEKEREKCYKTCTKKIVQKQENGDSAGDRGWEENRG